MADQKKVVVGRLWEQENNSKSGYLEFGLIGRLQILVTPNIKRMGDGNCDFNILMKIDDTPYGMLKNISKNIGDALYEDEDNGKKEEE